MDSAAGQGVRTRLVVPRYHFIKAATEIYIPAHPTLPLLRVGIPSSSTLFFGFLTTMTTTRALARVEHMTCAWFTSCMSLGGISNLLLSRIINSDPLHRIGIALLILNMLYFVALLLLQVVRFTFTPARVGYTLSHPIECLFVPTIVLAAATILNGLAAVAGREVGSGVRTAFQVAFWVYFAAALVVSVVCYTSVWARAEGSMHHMNPAWVLPVFPLMLCGSVAVAVVPTQTEQSALNIAICKFQCPSQVADKAGN